MGNPREPASVNAVSTPPTDPSSLSDDPAVNRLDDAIRHLRSTLRPAEAEESPAR
ncbi:hypothetical protein GP2_051_00260 [Gordonia paraffinivorans NBRC 108238]|uniref:Uncharacterized protein n=1 Tax=Gordonia paraffinivorans NBRC 108238 TaxID=1223543 RepID=A0ABQ0IR55_9ACTN|nr:hypothetical protein GP2_051_00260 [Gordonia paraffinivorans NBRC 108238]